MTQPHPHSPYAVDAAQLLGQRVRLARRQRRWSADELAERAGISRYTLRKVERGDPSVGLGIAFEVAALVGVPLFHADPERLTAELAHTRDRVALLPQRVRGPSGSVNDDF